VVIWDVERGDTDRFYSYGWFLILDDYLAGDLWAIGKGQDIITASLLRAERKE